MKRKTFIISLLIGFVLNLPCASAAQRAPVTEKFGVTFEQVPAKLSGITWVHNNAHSTERYLPETVGAGCAFFDYDNDGWMDVYLVNSGTADFYTPTTPLKNALYRNNRNGTFTDVTEKANVAASSWSTCAVWFDYDNDGKLDLFVSSFVVYDKTLNPLCTDSNSSQRYYCIPRLFKPQPSRLFRNKGDGTFADVSKESGIAASPGKSFGAVATDLNNDGLMDLFVANDTMPNFLFINKGNGKFEEEGLGAGVAYGETGKPRSGMGVDAADYDGDGWQDLFVANIDQEFFSLYSNQKDLTFIVPAR